MNIDVILILVVLTNLRLLGSSRLGASIRTVAVQGILVGLLLLLAPGHGVLWQILVLAIGSMALKGIVFPRLLLRALREADIRREVEPFVGSVTSLLVGIAALAASFWLGQRLPLPNPMTSPLLVPVALSSILIGLFLIVSRRKAVSQVLGFLVLENGIFTFGVGLVQELSLLVELGVLLDVFVAVFVMGIMIFHISREFDHLDADRLSTLKD
jgi:hydrogenase-4 component E